MIVIHRLGTNKTIIDSSNGPVYTYEYKRTINNGPTYITYSHSIEELTELKEKEVTLYAL
jgi:hypothetical protein